MSDQKLVKYTRKPPAPVAEASTALLVERAFSDLGPPLDLPVDRNPAAVYLANLGTKKGRDGMRSALAGIARILGRGDIEDVPWSELRYQHVMAIRSILAERYAHTTANKALAAIRGIAKQARNLDLMPDRECAKILDIKLVKGHREPAGRALEPDEIEALFATCDPESLVGLRNSVMLSLLYGMGLRREECAGVDVEHLNLAARTVRIIGKGNKERIVHLPPNVPGIISAWMQATGIKEGALLRAIDRHGNVKESLSDRGVDLILRAIGARAGVDKFSSHDMRRTYISDTLDRGDVLAVGSLVGHESATTTKRYDRSVERRKASVAGSIHVPVRLPK